jgi:hypothetical protein
MSEVTVTLELLSAMNLKMLAEYRLSEIAKLSEEFPNLPMADRTTLASYESAVKALDAAIAEAMTTGHSVKI